MNKTTIIACLFSYPVFYMIKPSVLACRARMLAWQVSITAHCLKGFSFTPTGTNLFIRAGARFRLSPNPATFIGFTLVLALATLIYILTALPMHTDVNYTVTFPLMPDAHEPVNFANCNYEIPLLVISALLPCALWIVGLVVAYRDRQEILLTHHDDDDDTRVRNEREPALKH